MLNTTAFILLAGNPEHWDNEIRERVEHGCQPGTFRSDQLCRLQIEQSGRGRRSAELVRSIYGWTVRHGSGLQDFSIMHSSRDHDPQNAYEWGCKWANEDPQNREFYVRVHEVSRCEDSGYDCSILRCVPVE